MSQLSKAPLRSAKYLKKIKEIQKVRRAIRWHERDRKERQQKHADALESKQTFASVRRHGHNAIRVRRRAVRDAREDWKLGPLRPNRAVGEAADQYGVVPVYDTRGPTISEKVQQRLNEVREKQGKEPVYPLVVDDKKYFPIVEDDRVVIIRGREKGKIGKVSRVIAQSHEVTVKDINKAYVDSTAYSSGQDEESDPKKEDDVPVPLSDVRLVVPYRVTVHHGDGNIEDVYQDVVVDKVVMERHTTGIDPFTRIDYGPYEFPEEHRFDPATGLPIFKRYVAGTRSIIQWPWEYKEEEFTPPRLRSSTETPEGPPKGRIMRTWSWLKGLPNASAKALSKAKREKEQQEQQQQLEVWQENKINTSISDAQKTPHLHARKESHLNVSSDDTTLRLVDPTDENRSFYPSLVYPPFPNELPDELPHEKTDVRSGQKDTSKAEVPVPHKAAQPKQVKVMKTPMQLRWEVERARKIQDAKPLVEEDVLLKALGMHMQAKGITLPPETDRGAGGELHTQ